MCRSICSECDRVVDNNTFNSQTDLCPECHKKLQQTNKEDDHEKEATSLEPAFAG